MEKYTQFGKNFLTWLVANLLGFAALGAAYFVTPPEILRLGPVVFLLILALVIGSAQWLALRRLLPSSPLWLLSTVLGGLLAWAALSYIPETFWRFLGDDESIAALSAGYVVIGLAIGLLQWLVLRPRLGQAWLWIIASALGAGGALWLVLVTDLVHQAGTLAFILAALVYASLTGLTLAGLLAAGRYVPRQAANQI